MPYPPVAHHWSAAYLQKRVAQSMSIKSCLMAYDSGLIFPRDYQTWTALSSGAEPKGAKRIRCGGAHHWRMSVSAEWTISHQTQAETLAHFARWAEGWVWQQRLDGIALYPFWETSVNESKRIARSLEPQIAA